jgi:hypothetical protein
VSQEGLPDTRRTLHDDADPGERGAPGHVEYEFMHRSLGSGAIG